MPCESTAVCCSREKLMLTVIRVKKAAHGLELAEVESENFHS